MSGNLFWFHLETIWGGVFIEGVPFDARYQPILFDGSMLEHWNSDDLVGNKYSLIFFT
jgi:hypothetical protein